MKLVFVFILAGFLSVNATETYSQNVRFDLKMENVSLKSILNEIEEKTDFNFIYQNDEIKNMSKLSVDVDHATVSEILDRLLKDKGMEYKIYDHYVLIQKKGTNETVTNIIQQPKNVSGKVTDSSGAPLPGVTVVIKGTTTGIVTDVNGNYSFAVPSNATLLFSFVGMKTQEIVVSEKTAINVVMQEEAIGIEEVVAIGYGTQKKVNLTGSIATVDNKQLENRSLVNLEEALQGTAANLNITTGSLGGEPGAQKEINIRGVGTLTGNGGTPYVLVDGMPMDLSNVDPDNIQSVSVLKDAASAAIYGARAAYGVILITTKSGKGKDINIQYNSSFSLQHPTIIPDYTSSVNAANEYNFAASNSGMPGISEEHMNRIIDYYNGDLDDSTIPNPNDPTKWGWNLGSGGNGNVNWPKVMWDNWRPRTKHNISFSGETENVRFYAAANYFYEKGLETWNPEKNNKYSLLSNVSVDVNKWITVNLNIQYTHSKLSRKIAPKNEDRQHQWGFVMLTPPFNPLYAPDGQVIADFVLEDQQSGREILTPDDLWLKIGTELEPIKDWKTSINYIWNYHGNRTTKNKSTVYHPLIGGGSYAWRYQNPSFIEAYSNNNSHIFNIYSSYEKSIGAHNFFGMIGYEEEYNELRSMGIERMGVISAEVPSLSTATGEMFLDNSWSHWSTQGFFSRITYNFKEKYLLEFDARYDGSSRFAKSSTKWGLFPSGSLAYNVSNEPFWNSIEDITSINSLKFRISYGSLGNQDVSQYLYLPIIPISENLPFIIGNSRPNYSSMPSLVSPDLTWETANTLNAGIDVGFFNSRLNLNFDVYNRKTTNMFGPSEQLPAALGTSTTVMNNAELETKGFELEVSWKDIITDDLSYNVKFNLGDSKSEVTKYWNPKGSLGGINLKDYSENMTGWYKGKDVGEIWGYETVGYFQDASDVQGHADQSEIYTGRWQAGDIKYKDLNNDGKIDKGNLTKEDHGDLKIIGNDMPRYQFGITLNVNYKNIDCRMFWQGVAKRDMVFATNFWDSFYGWKGMNDFDTYCKPHMDYWTPEGADFGGGTDAYFPRPYMTYNEDVKNKQYQTKYMQDASYIRLKDIQLGYTIPSHFTKKIGLKRVRAYISGSNLLTFSHLIKIFDPELLSKGALHGGVGTYIYPMQKFYTCGISVTF